MHLEVNQLVKTYGAQKALDSISFSLKKGEIVGFLGPNGAGKSTTMKIISCYLNPDSGTVKVCGLDFYEKPIEVKKMLGYLPENNPLYYDMYVKEYLTFTGSMYGLKSRTLQKRVDNMVELCGLGIEKHKKLGALSRGYRQRIGLAQALIHDPEVLILDEPTSGLDPNQLVEIRSVIKEIGKLKTILFSTHIMQEAQALCDRVIIINKGKICTDTTINEMKKTYSNNCVITEFEHPIPKDQLSQIKEINKIETSDNKIFRIYVKTGSDIRPDITQLSVKNNWKMIGLKMEEKSLEEIFKELTT